MSRKAAERFKRYKGERQQTGKLLKETWIKRQANHTYTYTGMIYRHGNKIKFRSKGKDNFFPVLN
jgi:hypothetical protein